MHERHWLRPTTIGLVLLLGILAGCAAPEGDAPAEDASPVRGGRVVVGITADPVSLNPVRMTTAQAARVLLMVHPGLFALDPATGRWKPSLATAWTIAADSTAVDVTLDTRLRWSDGEPFSARDVAASLDLYRDPAVAYPRASRLDDVADVTVVDDATLRVRYATRVGDPLGLLAHDVLPAHVVAELDRADPASWAIGRAPVTLGAYRLASWDTNDRLVLERNPHHPDAAGHLDAIEIVVVPDAAARLLRLRTGEIDVVGSVPTNQAASLRDEAGVSVLPVEGRSVAYLQYDLEDPRLQDVRVRRAIGLAIDRTRLVDGPLFGFGAPAASLLPPVSWGHDPDLAPSAYDPDAARALLDDAGFVAPGDGAVRRRGDDELRLTLHFVSGDPIREAVVTAMAAQLRDVGIELDTRPRELGALLQQASQEDFDLLFLQLGGPIDADVRPFLSSAGRFNFGSFADAEFDVLAERAATQPDRAAATRAAFAMQRRLERLQPISPLYYPAQIVAHRTRLRGLAPDWLSPFQGVTSWWVAPSAGVE